MAKMFYTMEETKAALGRNEEDVKQLAREGRLREFRDGPRLMFKADQVEALKGDLGGGGDAISMSPGSDSGAPIGMAGDSGGMGALADSSAGKEEGQFADIGLSGSLGGVPSPARPSPGDGRTGSGSGILNLGGGASGSGLVSGSGMSSGGARGGGITIFDADDSQHVDPSAQTAISAGVQDQINLEGVGSGSGLLDLTRESDDTSLGAVFDELTPGARRGGQGPAPVAMETQAGADIAAPVVDRSGRGSLAAPIYIEAADPVASALGAASLIAAAALVFGGFILGAALLGHRPDMLKDLALEANGKMYIILAFGVTLVFGIIGFVVGKMGTK